MNGRDNLATIAQLRLQTARRSNRAFAYTHRDIGFIFPADPSEKLIDDMDDANHGFTLFAQVRSLKALMLTRLNERNDAVILAAHNAISYYGISIFRAMRSLTRSSTLS